ncbi:sulfotransferase [Nocardioides nanhaiensis]|uniref:Sulfotransferase domain-containing protein n=1 Tax=Nocardioides nanhaiensis TaxID=1476871 RepID=A0ABP8WPS4_9ACTN
MALDGPGPAWVGIGAQRSGTTWLTDLVTQHPRVELGTNGKKEQQLLHKVADGKRHAADYLDLFPRDDGVLRGEWSPQYLRHATAPFAAGELLPDVRFWVLLRDPVDRYRSAMHLAVTREWMQRRSKRHIQQAWPYPVPTTVQTWSGCYADQLDMWAAAVGRERVVPMVFEQVRRDPQAVVDGLWRDLGLEPVPLADVTESSHSSSEPRVSWEWTPGLQETLRVLYRPQAERLERDWGLDTSAWTTLHGG